jgi:hypothetical protein
MNRFYGAQSPRQRTGPAGRTGGGGNGSHYLLLVTPLPERNLYRTCRTPSTDRGACGVTGVFGVSALESRDNFARDRSDPPANSRILAARMRTVSSCERSGGLSDLTSSPNSRGSVDSDPPFPSHGSYRTTDRTRPSPGYDAEPRARSTVLGRETGNDYRPRDCYPRCDDHR